MDDLYNLTFYIDLSGSDLIGRINLHYIIAFSSAVKDAASFDFIEKTVLLEEEPLYENLEIIIEASQSDRALFKKFNKFILFTAVSAIGPDSKNLCAAGKTSEFVFNNDSRKFLMTV